MTLNDAELDRLYGLALDEFVPERDALAQRLADAGASEHSAEVEALAKPSVVAWAINQIARQRRDLVTDLIAAVDRVRAAQVNQPDEHSDAASLPQALRDEKAALARIEEIAPTVLSEAGYVSSLATIDRALRCIRAAAVDERGRKQLESGRLAGDFVPPDSGDLTLREAPNPASGGRNEGRRARDTIDLELETQRRQAVLKREEQAERRRLELGRREQEEARRSAQKKIDAARRTLESCREAETRLEREYNGAQRERQEADRRLREAVRLAEQAENRLQEARSAREAAEQSLADLKTSTSGP